MAPCALQHRLNLGLLAAAAVTFLTGVVLLVAFHMDAGAFAASALGLPRLFWLDLHRLGSLALAVALAGHLWLDRRPFAAQLRRALRRDDAGARVELALYLSFWTTTLTGLAAWLLVSGSAPLAGPVVLERLPHTRHALVDLHFLAGLVALPLAVHHVAHRWRRLWRAPSRSARPAPLRQEA